MRKVIFLMVLLVVCIGLSTIPTQQVAASNPLVTQRGSTGYQAIATQTMTLATGTARIMGILPPGVTDVTVIVNSADINYGPSNVASGTGWPFIASGAQLTFTGLATRQPTIYFVPRSTTPGTISMIAK